MTGTDMIPVPILSGDTNDNFQFISGGVSNFQTNHKGEKKAWPTPCMPACYREATQVYPAAETFLLSDMLLGYCKQLKQAETTLTAGHK